MAERAPWWRAFMTRKKPSPGSKDQEVQPPGADPETQTGEYKSAPAAGVSTPPAGPQEEPAGSSLFSGESYDDAQVEPVFNEQSCRRNLKVSRSGRFKEKRRTRASLPEKYPGETAATEDEAR